MVILEIRKDNRQVQIITKSTSLIFIFTFLSDVYSSAELETYSHDSDGCDFLFKLRVKVYLVHAATV